MEKLIPLEVRLVFVLLSLGLVGACDPPQAAPAGQARGLRSQLLCAADECTFCLERARQRTHSCGECISYCASSTLPDCLSYCSNLCDPGPSCDAICDDPGDCLQHAMSFVPYGEPDSELEAACLRAYAQFAACGIEIADAEGDCRRFATLEDPAAATAAYDCFSALACDAMVDGQSACLPPTRHGLADWYRQLTIERGYDQPDETIVARLANVDGWMLPASAQAILECDGPDAEGISLDPCVLAWLRAVEPSRTKP